MRHSSYIVKLRHGKVTVIPNNMSYTSLAINDVTSIDSCQFILSSLNKLSRNLSKDQFRETKKYLELFYVQQPNQPQINNVTKSRKEDEVIHVYEDYRSHPYQLPTLKPDQQPQIEKDLALMTRKRIYPL